MPEPTEQQDEQTTAARKKTTAAVPEPVPDTTTGASASVYEPYPGAEYFHAGRNSPIFAAMGRRLEAEGCADGRPLGADFTAAHRAAFARWQKTLRPKEGGDVSGTPDEVAWDKLHVPRVTPLPRQEA